MVKRLILGLLVLCIGTATHPSASSLSLGSKVKTTYQNNKTAIILGGVGLAIAGLIYLRIPNQKQPSTRNLKVRTLIPSSEINTQSAETKPRKKVVPKHPKTVKRTSRIVARALSKRKEFIARFDNSSLGVNVHVGFPKEFTEEQFETITLYMGGGCNSSLTRPWISSYAAYICMRNGIISTPCVSFDWNSDHRAGFALGEEHDQRTIGFMINEIITTFKPKNVIVIANCRSALTFAAYLANAKKLPPELKAAILESPPLDLESFLKGYWGGTTAYKWFGWTCPSLKKIKTPLLTTKTFPKNFPIKFIQFRDDKLVPNKDTQAVVAHLQSLGCANVSLDTITCSQGKHGHMLHSAELARVSNRFYQENGLPYLDPATLKSQAERFNLLVSSS